MVYAYKRSLPSWFRLPLIAVGIAALWSSASWAQVTRYGIWQVTQQGSGDTAVCFLSTDPEGQRALSFSLKHSGDLPDALLLGILQNDGQPWGSPAGAMVPGYIWLDGNERQSGNFMITNMSNIVIERESIDAFDAIGAAAANRHIRILHFLFPLSGKEVALPMEGFSSALSAFKDCEVRLGLATLQTVNSGFDHPDGSETHPTMWASIARFAKRQCSIDIFNLPLAACRSEVASVFACLGQSCVAGWR